MPLIRPWCSWFSLCLLLTVSTGATADALSLARDYRPDLDLRVYAVSEKFDGIRAHWDGQQLRSRQGLPMATPAWFIQDWPQQAMDGELWAGRGQFAQVQSLVSQGAAAGDAWRTVRYMVFDLPQHPGLFAQRQTALHVLVDELAQPWVQAVPQWTVSDHPTLMRQLRSLSDAGAEGLMLRRTDRPYRGGRSDDLIKLKLYDDAEAVVLAHLPGQGKYQGLTGALLVETPQGLRFKIGSGLSDAERANPPPIGSTITYRYNSTHPSGVPRFARYWRVRTPSPAPGPTRDGMRPQP